MPIHSDEDFISDDRKERKTAKKIASRTDRSKFKKTDIEKRKRLLKGQADQKLSKKQLKRGRVLAISPEGILVDVEGEKLLCVLSGILKKEISRAKNLVTVGDFVLIEVEKAAIAGVEERFSVLSRQEHLHRRQQQLIAANIDQVLITVSVISPPLKPFLVDRYIIATCKGGMSPIIVVNKIDLLNDDPHEKKMFAQFEETYQKLGFKILKVSVVTGEGIEELKKVMKDKASVFSGQSGVGKSSLINAMTGLTLPIGDLAKKTQKGSHTTTTTQLLSLPFGGWCIDTPGIRSFGLWDLKREDLLHYFPEISLYGKECKYPNCTHSHEPSCAVQKALLEGKLSPLRVDSYLKLLDEAT